MQASSSTSEAWRQRHVRGSYMSHMHDVLPLCSCNSCFVSVFADRTAFHFLKVFWFNLKCFPQSLWLSSVWGSGSRFAHKAVTILQSSFCHSDLNILSSRWDTYSLRSIAQCICYAVFMQVWRRPLWRHGMRLQRMAFFLKLELCWFVIFLALLTKKEFLFSACFSNAKICCSNASWNLWLLWQSITPKVISLTLKGGVLDLALFSQNDTV